MEPADQLRPAADVDNGRHGNDYVSQAQYAEMMPTRRSERQRGPFSCRPYADDAQYVNIDHNLLKQTYLIVVDEP